MVFQKSLREDENKKGSIGILTGFPRIRRYLKSGNRHHNSESVCISPGFQSTRQLICLEIKQLKPNSKDIHNVLDEYYDELKAVNSSHEYFSVENEHLCD